MISTQSLTDRDLKTKKNFWYTVPESLRGCKAEVPEKFKEIFAKKEIKCCGILVSLNLTFLRLLTTLMFISDEYVDLPPKFEREIFQRVQLGVTLTTAGKLI